MKIKSAFAMLFAAALVAHAEPESKIIKVSDTAALEAAKDGEEVVVEGKVAKAEWSKSGKVANIEFEGDPKFMIVVFEKSRAKLDEAFGGDFTKQFTGATVRFTGKIAAYGGKAKKYEGATQMIVSQTGQVTVMVAATQPASEPAGM
ncbi:MAG: hypothetical protein QM754_15110 [Tepidisphaeraceae bacterium]